MTHGHGMPSARHGSRPSVTPNQPRRARYNGPTGRPRGRSNKPPAQPGLFWLPTQSGLLASREDGHKSRAPACGSKERKHHEAAQVLGVCRHRMHGHVRDHGQEARVESHEIKTAGPAVIPSRRGDGGFRRLGCDIAERHNRDWEKAKSFDWAPYRSTGSIREPSRISAVLWRGCLRHC